MSLGGKESSQNTTDTAETSAQASLRRGLAGSNELPCDACRETKKYFDVLEAPCGHGYCKSCLQQHFDQASTDESLFPPRCCRQPIDVNEAQIFLTKELRDKFERAKVEFSATNRTYCSRSTCSAFMPSNLVQGDTATCLECETETCVMCKARAHEGDCPEDSALHETLALANESGWQRCYSCRRLVELEVGCNHMRYVRTISIMNVPITDPSEAAAALLSSAMSVAAHGRNVLAPNGVKTGCSRGPTTSSTETYLTWPPTTRSGSRQSPTPGRCCGADTTARTPAGDISVARGTVRSVFTLCQITSLSVASVGFRLAIGVGETDCETRWTAPCRWIENRRLDIFSAY